MLDEIAIDILHWRLVKSRWIPMWLYDWALKRWARKQLYNQYEEE